MEIFAGEKATWVYGKDQWLPDETLTAMREFLIAIKEEQMGSDPNHIIIN